MSKNYQQFTEVSYSGRELLKKHLLTEQGTWQIYGEDQNCDFGGSHYSPLLDTVTGKLSDVIEYAVELRSFWTWGGGGDIRKINVKNVETVVSQKKEIASLKAQMKQIQDRLKELGVND